MKSVVRLVRCEVWDVWEPSVLSWPDNHQVITIQDPPSPLSPLAQWVSPHSTLVFLTFRPDPWHIPHLTILTATASHSELLNFPTHPPPVDAPGVWNDIEEEGKWERKTLSVFSRGTNLVLCPQVGRLERVFSEYNKFMENRKYRKTINIFPHKILKNSQWQPFGSALFLVSLLNCTWSIKIVHYCESE